METELIYRMAVVEDAGALGSLRWDFSRPEYQLRQPLEEFLPVFREQFFLPALNSGSWAVFVAEDRPGHLIGNMYVQVIAKIPRPGQEFKSYGYVTNVYVRPEWRSRGVGSQLLRRMIEWARRRPLQFLILWPAQPSIEFYRRHGFRQGGEAMELRLED